MAQDLNQCTFTGRLPRDPETRHTDKGVMICAFTVAVSDSWINKSSGEREDVTEWVSVSAFGKLAEVCDKYLEKGSRVFVQGKMQTRKYEKDGEQRQATGIVLDPFYGKMMMLDPPKKSSTDGGSSRPQAPSKQAGQTQKRSISDDSGYGVDPKFDDDITF